MTDIVQLTLPNQPRQYWASVINEAWRKSAQAVIETGLQLVGAKAQLARDQFEAMVESDLAFGQRTAYRLMAVAEDPRLLTHVSKLPPSWGTLYQITRLDDTTFGRLLDDGVIRPDVERKEIAQHVAAKRAPRAAG